MRGSDTNAALYYLAHLLETGDLVAVSRRLLVMAYEDIGLANPEVGPHMLAAIQAAERLDYQRHVSHLQVLSSKCALPQNPIQPLWQLMLPLRLFMKAKQAIFHIICEMLITRVPKI